MFRERYAEVFRGDERWRNIDVATGSRFTWAEESTYVRPAPFFDTGTDQEQDIRGARVLALLGDTVTTDHISPAGPFGVDTPAGKYLLGQGVPPAAFNTYGSRRGNHEVMVRGTFANIRLRNRLVPGVEGGWTRHLPDGARMTIYEAAMAYQADGVPLIVIAGKEYGTGSSRDWAAKGPRLLGVRAVIAESFERIHRSNLVGMGILPLQFQEGENADTLKIQGTEVFDVVGIRDGLEPGKRLTVLQRDDTGTSRTFQVTCRLDTPQEVVTYRHGGLLPHVLRQMVK